MPPPPSPSARTAPTASARTSCGVRSCRMLISQPRRRSCSRLIRSMPAFSGDAWVRRLKGQYRRVREDGSRAEVRAAFEAVALAVLSEGDTPIELITQIKPSALVKGGDYTREQVVGHEVVEAAGGEVLLVDILAGHSTTSLVDRARGGKA